MDSTDEWDYLMRNVGWDKLSNCVLFLSIIIVLLLLIVLINVKRRRNVMVVDENIRNIWTGKI